MASVAPEDHRGLAIVDAPPTFVMIGDLLAEPDEEIPYVVDGMLVTAGTSLVVAKPKVGKTTFVENLALSTSRGTSFLGRATQRGLVLYLVLEEKRAEVRRTFGALGAAEDDQIGLWVYNAPSNAVDWLAEEMLRLRPILVIIDTVQRFLRLPDLNDYAIVSNALEPVTALARETGAHILMTHHGNKVGGNHGDAVLGSTALFGSVDTLVELRRQGARRTIWTDQRYGENLEESVLEFDRSTHRLSLAGTCRAAEADAAARAICDYLDNAPDPVDEKALCGAVGGNHAMQVSVLRSLVDSGEVARDGRGVRGSPFLYSRTHSYRGVPEYENPPGDVALYPR